MLFLKPDVTKKNRELFFRRTCKESSEHNWANIAATICPEMLVFWHVGLLDVALFRIS